MKTKRINGLKLEAMLRSGLNNLRHAEQEINDLNVFPVPDGDTGSNMRLTLEHGLVHAKPTVETGAFLKKLSDGMLLGARGNSGVILSQIFRGIALELSRTGSVSAAELRNGFIRGYRTAYEAVARPVEGTILTVSREGIEAIRTQVGRSTFIEDFLGMYVAEMQKSLAHTPEMLPVLKEAGVVDSGAAGFIRIVDGMVKCLYGEAVQPPKASAVPEKEPAPGLMELPEDIPFDEKSTFEYGYCVEFILQRMNGEAYRRDFTVPAFTDLLKAVGESIVVVENDMRVKVHVHTMKPSRVFRIAEKYGEFLTVKVENMQLQHNEHVKKQEVERPQVIRKDFCITAVANSAEMGDIFKSLGADVILDGGKTMNTSSEDFLKAFSLLDAKTIVVLPNNKNIIPAAQQAAEMVNDKQVVVLPSKSFAEGYYALAMDVPGSPDHAYRIESMKSGIERVTTLTVTKATRDYHKGDVEVKSGAWVAIVGHTVVSAEETLKDAVIAGLKCVPDLGEKENCFVFAGENALTSDGAADEVAEWVNDEFPSLEVTVMEGHQPVYDWIFGLV